ncbi:MAG: Holliday junction branch migration protein RuvA [Lachnospiraceae bacterium]|nr:Holliday junction branch migration protein RuvA [Lachnospiraceae bacterium]
MLSYIKGLLTEKLGDCVVVEANGVGYQIFVPVSLLSELPPLGETVKIYTYFNVTESGVSLFGFLNRQDLDMFRKLIGVNGVGPKSAVGILSALRPDELRVAVAAGDIKMISRAPGVGSKTAQRIILDLKDKISSEELIAGMAGDASLGADRSAGLSGLNEAGREAVSALTALGYSGAEAAGAVQKVEIREGMTAEEVLKAALKHLTFL